MSRSNFWSKVQRGDADACWLWTGYVDNVTGHGSAWIDGKQTSASRVAWELTNGPVPDGQIVCHSCDSLPCCNPAHLFLGGHQKNLIEMDAEGHGRRSPRGMAVLTKEKALLAKRMYAEGTTQTQIAKLLGVHSSSISRLVRGETWSNLDGADVPKGVKA